MSTVRSSSLEKHHKLLQLEQMCSHAAERWYETDGQHRVVWCVGQLDSQNHIYSHTLYILIEGYMPDSPNKRFSYFRSVYRTKDQRRHG